MSDLVGNPEDRFSKNEAHITSLINVHVGGEKTKTSMVKYIHDQSDQSVRCVFAT